MANDEHVALLKQGVAAWNAWRDRNPYIRQNLNQANLRGATISWANLLIQATLREPDLSEADLSEANLIQANLSGANLTGAHLSKADLSQADLHEANLSKANLSKANLSKADLSEANLFAADLHEANLSWADLHKADLYRANLGQASLFMAKLNGADLYQANLSQAGLRKANLTRADLRGADLRGATLIGTYLTDADLTGCRIYGVSAWELTLEGAKQQNLIITNSDYEPEITVDNIEVAQFIYLLLHNEKIRDVIDTIGKKAVLILGRFTADRKAVLDALREELRKRDYLPILFDFEKPASRDLTATVSTLAHLARFVIADITDPSSIPYELATVVPTTPVPIQPMLLSGSSEFAMFRDLQRRHHWVLTTHLYASQAQLIADLGEKVIRPAELKVQNLRGAGQP
jgi:uncharacterized protein YjbI with pentapeptide repeats